MRGNFWGVVGCAAGMLTSPALAETAPAGAVARQFWKQAPMTFTRLPAAPRREIAYIARGPGYAVRLTQQSVTFLVAQPQDSRTLIDISPVSANPQPRLEGVTRQLSRSNYFAGVDPANWRRNVTSYGAVRYRNVYPGIDLVYHGQGSRLEYDFTVAPGAHLERIRLDIRGGDGLRLDGEGNLRISVAHGELVQHAPVAYQDIDDGRRVTVPARYALIQGPDHRTLVRFDVGRYDTSKALVIDPVLSYASYIGGVGGDAVAAVSVDQAGNIYLVGTSDSPDFPITSGKEPKNIVCHTGDGCGTPDNIHAFVMKLDPSGARIIFSTFLQGSADDAGNAIAVDAIGNVYVTGSTASTDFPVTPGAWRPTKPSGSPNAFVAKLSPLGVLAYSTYIGGTGASIGHAIAVDGSGNAYVTGSTTAADFPTTAGAAQPQTRDPAHRGDAFVTKLNAAGTAAVYSTLLGGQGVEVGLGIAVDETGSAYVAGQTDSADFPAAAGAVRSAGKGLSDAFVVKLSSDGSTWIYSTLLGGNDVDAATAIAIDAAHAAYITGNTASADFPSTPGAPQPHLVGSSDAFVAKLNAAGSALVYATYLGGSDGAGGQAIAVDAAGHAYIVGTTASRNFPVTPQAIQPRLAGRADAFVSELDGDGSRLLYSSFLGGSETDTGLGLALNRAGAMIAAGATVTGLIRPNYFPVTGNALQPRYGGTCLVWGPLPFCMSFAGDGFIAITAAQTFVSGTMVAVSDDPAIAGQPLNISAFVSGDHPTGNVTFFDDSGALGVVALSGMSATFTTTSLAPGDYTIRASYGGDARNPPTDSQPVIAHVRAASTTTLTLTPSHPQVGEAPTLTAVVKGSSPTGVVSFGMDGNALGTAALSSGTATFTTPALTAIAHDFGASYGGDAHNLASESDVISVDLTPATPVAATGGGSGGTGGSGGGGGGGGLGAFELALVWILLVNRLRQRTSISVVPSEKVAAGQIRLGFRGGTIMTKPPQSEVISRSQGGSRRQRQSPLTSRCNVR